MPSSSLSRDFFCNAIQDANGLLFLTEREPFAFQDLADTREHVANEGDTWQSLAARYFAALPQPEMLWWVIADFQPGGGVFDPTIAIAAGTRVYVPSLRVLEEEIFSEARRAETNA